MGANILAVFPVPSQSHFYLGHYLMRQLADREHNVTFVSPYKQHANHTNIKFVKLDGLYGTGTGFLFQIFFKINFLSNFFQTFMDFSKKNNYLHSTP